MMCHRHAAARPQSRAADPVVRCHRRASSVIPRLRASADNEFKRIFAILAEEARLRGAA